MAPDSPASPENWSIDPKKITFEWEKDEHQLDRLGNPLERKIALGVPGTYGIVCVMKPIPPQPPPAFS